MIFKQNIRSVKNKESNIKMKRFFLTTVLLAATLVSGENLLTNSSFESTLP